MRHLFSNVFLLYILLMSNSIALTLMGEGYGESETEARKQALSALSESIYIEVKSEFESRKSSSGDNTAKQVVSTRSDLPILGANFNVISMNNEYFCSATLSSDTSLLLYKKRLKLLQKDIQNHYAEVKINSSKSNKQYQLLTELLTMLDQFEKYYTVALMLGDNTDTNLVVSKSKIKNLLFNIESLAPSLDIAANILSKEINYNNIYIYPATPAESHEVTAFGRLLKNNIASKLNTEKNINNADYFLKGTYEILKNSIHVTYYLLDYNENTLATRIVNIASSAYRSISYKPKTINFDKLLHQGSVVSHDFKVNLNTHSGNENLLFTEGEEIELFIKLNKSGYYYIVSYIKNKTEDYSYILELSAANTSRRHVNYVNADDANRWMSLGKFEVSEPFGIESLQVIASNKDLINHLPSVYFDPKTGLYLAAEGEAEEVIIKTRALKPIKKKGSLKIETTETVLMMTTMRKNLPE